MQDRDPQIEKMVGKPRGKMLVGLPSAEKILKLFENIISNLKP